MICESDDGMEYSGRYLAASPAQPPPQASPPIGPLSSPHNLPPHFSNGRCVPGTIPNKPAPDSIVKLIGRSITLMQIFPKNCQLTDIYCGGDRDMTKDYNFYYLLNLSANH